MRRAIPILAALVTVLLVGGLFELVQLRIPGAPSPSSATPAQLHNPATAHPQMSFNGDDAVSTQVAVNAGSQPTGQPTVRLTPAPPRRTPSTAHVTQVPTGGSQQPPHPTPTPPNPVAHVILNPTTPPHPTPPIAAPPTPSGGSQPPHMAIVIRWSPVATGRQVVRHTERLGQNIHLVSGLCNGAHASFGWSDARHSTAVPGVEGEAKSTIGLAVGHPVVGLVGQLLLAPAHARSTHGDRHHPSSSEDRP
jgi:hypothetical protein